MDNVYLFPIKPLKRFPVYLMLFIPPNKFGGCSQHKSMKNISKCVGTVAWAKAVAVPNRHRIVGYVALYPTYKSTHLVCKGDPAPKQPLDYSIFSFPGG